MNYNLISIVIPCYNDAKYIEQSVLSALSQTYPYKEVIIVDDGSNSETKELLKEIEPKVTKLIIQENQGQSRARNVGVKYASGKYILVLDSDDYFEPSFCERAIELFSGNVNVRLVTCRANLVSNKVKSEVYIPGGGDISNFLFTNDALGTSMFKKEDWINCGGYDEDMRQGFEDWEFFIRLLGKGGICEVIHEPLYNYRKRSDTTTSVANAIKYDLLRYIYFKNQHLFINHFESFVDYLLQRIEREEKEKLKVYQKIDFRVGNFMLSPLRYMKSIFK